MNANSLYVADYSCLRGKFYVYLPGVCGNDLTKCESNLTPMQWVCVVCFAVFLMLSVGLTTAVACLAEDNDSAIVACCVCMIVNMILFLPVSEVFVRINSDRKAFLSLQKSWAARVKRDSAQRTAAVQPVPASQCPAVLPACAASHSWDTFFKSNK